MATKANPSPKADAMVACWLMPPSRMMGVDGSPELAGVREEVGLLVGVAAQEAPADDLEAEPDCWGQGGGELLQGCFAAEEVHGIGQRAAPGELERIQAPSCSKREATSRLSSSHKPPSTPSAMLSLAVTAVSGPTSSRTVRRTARGTRPVLDGPAELVIALVEFRAEEHAQQVVVSDVHLDAVEARLDREAGGAAVVVGDALDAGASTRAARPIGVKPPDGERAGAPLDLRSPPDRHGRSGPPRPRPRRGRRR